MYKVIFFCGLIMLMASLPLSAQQVEFKRSGERKIEGIKALSNKGDMSVIQTSVFFQNVTKRSIIVSERNALGAVLGRYAGGKSGGNTATAELTAYLVFSDGEPSDAEYQKVSDDFHAYLISKLKQANISVTDWNEITASSMFTELYEEKEDKVFADELTKKGNAWKVFTANKGPRIIRYNPMSQFYNTPAVKGTMRLANLGKEMNSETLLGLSVNVDFADIHLEGEASSGTANRTFSSVNWKKSTIRYNIAPQLRATARENGGNMLFIFPVKSKAFEEAYMTTDLRASKELNALVEQDPAKAQKRSFLASLPSFSQRHEIDPFVVEVSKADYFAQVNEVLKVYADELVKTIASLRK